MFEDFEILDVFGPLELFGVLRDDFSITLVGPEAGPVRSFQGPRVMADQLAEADAEQRAVATDALRRPLAPHVHTDGVYLTGGLAHRRASRPMKHSVDTTALPSAALYDRTATSSPTSALRQSLSSALSSGTTFHNLILARDCFGAEVA